MDSMKFIQYNFVLILETFLKRLLVEHTFLKEKGEYLDTFYFIYEFLDFKLFILNCLD